MHKEAQAEPRTCYRCQRARPLTEFYVEAEKRRAATLGRRTFTYPCRSCQSELAAERMAPRRAIVDAARDVGCTDCGLIDLEHPEIFDFDHLDGTTKAGNVAAFLSKGTLDDLRKLQSQVKDAASSLENSIQSTVSETQAQFDALSSDTASSTGTTGPSTDWDKIYAVRRSRDRIRERRVERARELGHKLPKRRR